MSSFKDSSEVKDVLINSYIEPRGLGVLGGRKDGMEARRVKGLGRARQGVSW